MPYTPDVYIPAAPFVLTIVGALAASALILLTAFLLDSDLDLWPVRLNETFRLARLRMGRMVVRRGIGIGAYARGLSLAELRRQIAVCRECSLTEICDRAVRAPAANPRTRYSFCPNQPFIDSQLVRLARAV